jgi:hypothetical protein
VAERSTAEARKIACRWVQVNCHLAQAGGSCYINLM